MGALGCHGSHRLTSSYSGASREVPRTVRGVTSSPHQIQGEIGVITGIRSLRREHSILERGVTGSSGEGSLRGKASLAWGGGRPQDWEFFSGSGSLIGLLTGDLGGKGTPHVGDGMLRGELVCVGSGRWGARGADSKRVLGFCPLCGIISWDKGEGAGVLGAPHSMWGRGEMASSKGIRLGAPPTMGASSEESTGMGAPKWMCLFKGVAPLKASPLHLGEGIRRFTMTHRTRGS